MSESIDEVVSSLRHAIGSQGRITVLTGAGVSAESGLATFRGSGGLWEKHRFEDVATPQAFARDPELVLRFYNERRRQLGTVRPNPAHFALARLEEVFAATPGALPGNPAILPGDPTTLQETSTIRPRRFTLITQNVDDLHERAGSRDVLHMHGELAKARCTRCEKVVAWMQDVTPSTKCTGCGGQMRPHIVWFGEVPFYLEDRIPEALDAEVFVSVGTSGSVYPAAGMVLHAKLHGRTTVEVNLEPSENTHLFDHRLLGKAGIVLPELVQKLLGA